MSAYILNARDVRDIAPDILDASGRLQIMPASYYEKTTPEERMLACVRHGLYGLHTEELVSWLLGYLSGRSAIEVGAGSGVLAEALGIIATDNYLQEWPEIRQLYDGQQQRPVRYGANVERIDGIEAIKKYRPQVVVSSWLTHRWRPEQHWRSGNQYAPDEQEILRLCEEYILVGNTHTHSTHPLLDVAPLCYIEAPWIYSRALEGQNFIATWRGRGEAP